MEAWFIFSTANIWHGCIKVKRVVWDHGRYKICGFFLRAFIFILLSIFAGKKLLSHKSLNSCGSFFVFKIQMEVRGK